jgi:hypothetical protein
MFYRSYSWGYTSRDAAQAALDDEVSESRLSARDCRIRSYLTSEGKRRWQIEELSACV